MMDEIVEKSSNDLWPMRDRIGLGRQVLLWSPVCTRNAAYTVADIRLEVRLDGENQVTISALHCGRTASLLTILHCFDQEQLDRKVMVWLTEKIERHEPRLPAA